MRMWMVDPRFLCRQHLLGEHGELHKHLHNWEKKHSIAGRITGNAIEPRAYKTRHDQLAEEMILRGYNHNSPLEQPDFSYLSKEEYLVRVNRRDALILLTTRCPHCRERYLDFKTKELATSVASTC